MYRRPPISTPTVQFFPNTTLVRSNDGWHLHYRDPQQSLAEVLKALFSVGTALHLVVRGMHRLGRCTLDECTNIYADTSRNGNQRYCSPTCANRDRSEEHTSELQSLMSISYAVFCLTKKYNKN